MRSTFLSVLTVFALTSCHFNSQYINREEDKKDAEKVTTKLFDLLKAKKYEQTTDLFSESFFAAGSKETLFQIFAATDNKLGELQDTKIASWETKVVEGSDPSATYQLLYKNKYQKFEGTVNIMLSQGTDGKIRIDGYTINSDGFFK